MAAGKVKWFNNAKGFGFIIPENSHDDVFAHHSAINMDGYRSLAAGDSVTFELEDNDKGLRALNIQKQ
jgi:CspA family cold shock protein